MSNFFKTCLITTLFLLFFSDSAFAIQTHREYEGIVVHQIGHLFFIFSMVILILTITSKELHRQKGWRLIQWAAFFFILWNMAAFTGHLLDNQLHTITVSNISLTEITIMAENGSRLIEIAYYRLNLDHLLCVPAIIFLYRGLCHIPVKEAS